MCNYVQNRNGTYYFRRIVPAELRPLFGGRREWTYSLRTKDKREAERQARIDAVAIDGKIEVATSDLASQRAIAAATAPCRPYSMEISEEQLEAMEFTVEEDARLELEYEKREPDRRKILAAMAAGEEFVSISGPALQDILRDHKYEAEVAKEHLEIARYLAREAAKSPPEPTPSSEPVAVATEVATADGPYLEDIIPKWAAERRSTPKTVDAHKAVVRWFEERAGHVPLRSLARRHVLVFKDKMLAEGVTPANANVKLTRLRTLLNYAVMNDFIPTNPAKGVVLIDPDAGRNRRRPFDRASLAAIFGSPVYSQDSRPKDGRGEAAYWLPLLALFTGARLEELGQMRPQDVEHEPYLDDADHEQHAWALRITEDQEDGLKLKNSGSERLVPIHPDLEKLGFVRFAQTAQAARQERLFPELQPDKYGRRTAKWGEWFGLYKRDVAGVIDGRMVFHSFRHTFKDQARDAKIPEGVQRKLMGHAGKDEADAYGDGHGFNRLVESMKTYRIAGFKLPPPPPAFRQGGAT
jgi:integrase